MHAYVVNATGLDRSCNSLKQCFCLAYFFLSRETVLTMMIMMITTVMMMIRMMKVATTWHVIRHNVEILYNIICKILCDIIIPRI